jgi:hypothetical protein
MSAIDRMTGEKGKAALLGYHSACAPLLGIRRLAGGAKSGSCVDFNDSIIRHIEENRADIDTVILIARWALNASSTRPSGEPGPPVYLATKTGETGPNEALFKQGLDNTIRRLNALGVRTIILGGIPEIGWNVPRRLATFSRFGLRAADGPAYSEIEKRNTVADRFLSDAAERYGAEFIPIAPIFCNPACAVIEGDRPLYVDDDHLSVYGAVNVLAPRLSAILKL